MPRNWIDGTYLEDVDEDEFEEERRYQAELQKLEIRREIEEEVRADLALQIEEVKAGLRKEISPMLRNDMDDDLPDYDW